MGLKRKRTIHNNSSLDHPSAPPGFASLTSFKLRKVENREPLCGSTVAANPAEGDVVKMNLTLDETDASSIKKYLRQRPWMLGNVHMHEQEEHDYEIISKELPSRTLLPKGVVRGSADCTDFLQVMATWRPDNARKNALEEAPVYRPTEEEFKDTLNYIANIHPQVEAHGGICRIVPPASWDLPCRLKEKHLWEESLFVTQIQRIDGLQEHHVQSKMTATYENGSDTRKTSNEKDSECGDGDGCNGDHERVGRSDIETETESEMGPNFTLESFKNYADNFKSKYFRSNSNNADSNDSPVHQESREPSLDDIEGEYNRIVENPTEEIEVLYGGDVNCGIGSGFPTKSCSPLTVEVDKSSNSGWNLNCTAELPFSLHSFESFKTSGYSVPKLKIGMCFSSSCWKVDDHHLYSLSYMHLGDPKIWYAIPPRCNVNFEAVMKKSIPDSTALEPKLQQRLVSKLSAPKLKSEGIPVYRCVQYPGEFVLVLPGAYHSWFDSGFNCAEAVNVAPIEWLPHGQHVAELYCERKRKTSVSQDKLLLDAASKAVRAQWEISLLKKNNSDNVRWRDACGKDGILAKTLKSRIRIESNRREHLCNSLRSKRMDQEFDATTKRECHICYYDLHLSASFCPCSPDRYSCLIHSKHLCSCPWSKRIFLLRDEISELNTLVEALEGKLSAVYKWARERLKLSLFKPSEANLKAPRTSGLDSHIKELEEKDYSRLGVKLRNNVSSIREQMKAQMEKVRHLTAEKQKQKPIFESISISSSSESETSITTRKLATS